MSKTRAFFLPVPLGLALLCLALLYVGVSPSDAAARSCFGKKVNRVIKASNQKIRLGFKDVVWISGRNVTVTGRPYSRICAGAGSQTVRAGKGRSMTDTGAGNDRIILHAKSNLNVARGGLGNDVILGSNGNDFLYGSPTRVPSAAADRDVIRGLRGNDTIYDYGGVGNQLFGVTGVDRIYSLGSAISSSFGGNGSDLLFSDGGQSRSGLRERLFGDRGNDRLNADRPGSDGPAYLDGGSGDDWLNGTSFADTILIKSGITKVKAGGGDDLLVATSGGVVTVDGGEGDDSISWATHTPSEKKSYSGVQVDLSGGSVGGVGIQSLSNVENVVGSSFDDTIIGKPGVRNNIYGGLGDDTLVGQYGDGDTADGGLGLNDCSGFAEQSLCGENSPGNVGRSSIMMDINQSGVLTVLGSVTDDEITVDYDPGLAAYRVTLSASPAVAGLCEKTGTEALTVTCPADANNLNGVLVYGDDGADRVTVGNTVPAIVTTNINGGSGRNVLTGSNTRDTISAESDGIGTVINGGGNDDQLYMVPDGTAFGGSGSDVIHNLDPCAGGSAAGGTGDDNLVFASSPGAVKANLAAGYARWTTGSCADVLEVGPDIESLEGTRYNDVLILGRKLRTQTPRRSLLGRGGTDVLNSRNGVRDSVTTGDGGRGNRVISDRVDKVIYGWGYAAF
jgi:Ca2+-binding RTX toxin-like protein